LAPVDNTAVPEATLDQIMEEARAAESKVILLGVVPIHIYSTWEKGEVEKVRKEISAGVKKAKKRLNDAGIETKDMILSGYPDEEIVRVAEEYAVSMIIIPSGGDTPSELSKAANILLDETDAIKRPVVIAAGQ
jgi:nucleotide-binding universal stress UspA family protein